LTFLNVVFTAVHFFVRPYTLILDNFFEGLSLITLTTLTLFLIDADQPLSAGYAAGLSVMCFVVGAVLFSRIVLNRYDRFVRDRAETARLRKGTVLSSPRSGGSISSRDASPAALEGEAVAAAAVSPSDASSAAAFGAEVNPSAVTPVAIAPDTTPAAADASPIAEVSPAAADAHVEAASDAHAAAAATASVDPAPEPHSDAASAPSAGDENTTARE
jgi:hypothetical protein